MLNTLTETARGCFADIFIFFANENILLSLNFIIPPPNEVGVGGDYWIHLVRPSVRLSVDDMVSGA